MSESTPLAVPERFDSEGFAWQSLDPALRPALDALAERLVGGGEPESARVVKANPHRRVWRATLAGQPVFIKHHRVSKRGERLKAALLPGRCEREWRAGLALRAAGFDVAPPLAFATARRGPGPGITEWVHVARAVDGLRLDERLRELSADPGARRALLDATLDLASRLDDAGFVHADLHDGNLLARRGDDLAALTLVDLRAVTRPTLARDRARRAARVKLAHSLWLLLPDDEFEPLLARLGDGDEAGLRQAIADLETVRLRSRTRRCVVESSRFAVERAEGWRVFRRRDLPHDSLLAAVRRLDETTAGGSELRLGDLDARLQRRRGSQRRHWLELHGREVRGQPGPRGLAYLERRRAVFRRESLLFTTSGATPQPAPPE